LKAESFDKFPAALFSAEAERDAFKAQRDQAYGEIDDLCRERIDLKLELEKIEVGRLTENGDRLGGQGKAMKAVAADLRGRQNMAQIYALRAFCGVLIAARVLPQDPPSLPIQVPIDL
jgi:hypothetical protein